MERKIGEIFEYNGEWHQAIDNTNNIMCSGCTFVNGYNECEADINIVGNCGCKDGNPLIFKKLEKVGEPYEFDGHIFQSYRTFEVPIFTENYATVRELGNNSKISIEIKQTKEDMEEKKTNFVEEIDALCKRYNMSDGVRTDFISELKEIIKDKEKCNLKPFNLEAAKQGKPVCTRDGRKARIICFDKKGDYPIVALVNDYNKEEYIKSYDKFGKKFINGETTDDLMMLPEKKEGWINIYKGGLLDTKVYNTKEEAFNKASLNDYVDTVKICWEE